MEFIFFFFFYLLPWIWALGKNTRSSIQVAGSLPSALAAWMAASVTTNLSPLNFKVETILKYEEKKIGDFAL